MSKRRSVSINSYSRVTMALENRTYVPTFSERLPTSDRVVNYMCPRGDLNPAQGYTCHRQGKHLPCVEVKKMITTTQRGTHD